MTIYLDVSFGLGKTDMRAGRQNKNCDGAWSPRLAAKSTLTTCEARNSVVEGGREQEESWGSWEELSSFLFLLFQSITV